MAADGVAAALAQACAVVRPAGPADAVAGVRPQAVAVPASTDEAAAVMRAAAGLGLTVLPRGSGTRLHWGNPPQRCDLVIDTAGLNQVIEHAAGDLVATVQAGVRLDRLGGVLAAAGQRLALDPPGGGTVGGVVATGAAGPLRLRYGTPRDLLIGITVVRPDGAVARSGGKVVKNVAGYDLGKLFAGSRGTLGLITQATFRLHPLPAEVAYVTAECAAAVDACQVIAAALDSPVSPSAAEVDWPSASEPVRICVALEGSQAGVVARASALSPLLNRDAAPVVRPQPPPWWGAGPAAQRDGTVVQVVFWPGDLGMVLAEIRTAAEAAGLDPAIGGAAAAGVLSVALPGDVEPEAVAALIAALRGAVGHGNGTGSGGRAAAHTGGRSSDRPPARANVTVLHAPPAVGTLVDVFGPVPSVGLMRAVKRQFDPAGTMAPGRFAGGI
jgi:glycolate oxidase FAD binding subunit